MAEMFKHVEATLDKDWEQKAGAKLSKILEDLEDYGVEIAFRKGHYIVCGTWEQVSNVRDHLIQMNRSPVHTGYPFTGHNSRHTGVGGRPFLDNFSNLPRAVYPEGWITEGSGNNPIDSRRRGEEERQKEKRDIVAEKPHDAYVQGSDKSQSQSGSQKLPVLPMDDVVVVHGNVEQLQAGDTIRTDLIGPDASGREEGGKIQELLVDSDVWDYIEAKMSTELDQIQNFGAKIEKVNDDSGMIKLRLSSEDADVVSLVYDCLVTLHADTWKKVVIETFEFRLDDASIVQVVTENVNRHFPRVHIKQSAARDNYQFIGPAVETNRALTQFRQLASGITSKMEHRKRQTEEGAEVKDYSKNNNLDREMSHAADGVRSNEPIQGPVPQRYERLADDEEELDDLRDRYMYGHHRHFEQYYDDKESLEGEDAVGQRERNTKQYPAKQKNVENLEFRCGVNEEEFLPQGVEATGDEDDEHLQKSLKVKDKSNRPDESSNVQANSLDENRKSNVRKHGHLADRKVKSYKSEDIDSRGGHPDIRAQSGRSRELMKKLQDKELNVSDDTVVEDQSRVVKLPSGTKSVNVLRDNGVAGLVADDPLEDAVDRDNGFGTKLCKASLIPGLQDLKKFLQPDGGLFGTVIDQKSHLSGHENVGTIVVNMQFAAGEQGLDQPQPGRAYHAMKLTAYLPASRDGKEASRLMSVAFKKRKLIKIEYKDGVGNLVPDDVEFKTELDGKNGYPDTEYVTRVLEQLTVKAE